MSYKKGLRYNQMSIAPFQCNEGQRYKLQTPCNFCRNIYPFWMYHCMQRLIRPKEGEFPFSDQTAIARGSNYQQFRDSQVGRAAPIWLRNGEYGEAYHALMCCLYCTVTGTQIPMSINLPTTGDFADDMYDLFQWYYLPVKRADKLEREATRIGQKVPTKKIAEIFNQPLGVHVSGYRPTLFHQLRQYLDSQTTDIKKGTNDGGIMERYFYPSWEAKYWLNRYLRLTNQPRNLPKKHEVSRLAIIHVRLDAKSLIGRTMTGDTLDHVASSIAKANERVLAWNASISFPKGHSFTHVILYGDFNYSNGLKFKERVESVLGKDIKVLFISGPWRKEAPIQRGENNNSSSINNKVEELWARFRDIRFDGMPPQAKILNVWNALCKRYSPKACIIGHRSGFIEGAGLIGMPIFYLNNERTDLEKALKRRHKPGELLWGSVRDPKADRLRELSDVMNTFIPVEALEARPRRDGATLEISDGYEDELMSALFMFMCCHMYSSRAESYKVWPAWTSRVDMMHDKQGQKWLYERYKFATGKTAGYEPTDWTGDAFEAWLKGAETIKDYELDLQKEGLINLDL
ncbi:hypothetical protein ACHAPJ_009643 [Fusarium lateritium]